MQSSPSSIVEVAGSTTPGSSRGAKRREGASRAPPSKAPEIVEIPPSPEAAIALVEEGGSALPVTKVVAKTRPKRPELTGPFSTALPPSGIIGGSAMIQLDVSITLDAGLAERLLGFILQPRD